MRWDSASTCCIWLQFEGELLDKPSSGESLHLSIHCLSPPRPCPVPYLSQAGPTAASSVDRALLGLCHPHLCQAGPTAATSVDWGCPPRNDPGGSGPEAATLRVMRGISPAQVPGGALLCTYCVLCPLQLALGDTDGKWCLPSSPQPGRAGGI